jgi:pescadillo protein
MLGKLKNNKPSYKIDHIVKERFLNLKNFENKIEFRISNMYLTEIWFERYPNFGDAIKDLDDCLSLIFLFANLPKSKRVYVERVHLAKRLSRKFSWT